jgi:hypothetical protein
MRLQRVLHTSEGLLVVSADDNGPLDRRGEATGEDERLRDVAQQGMLHELAAARVATARRLRAWAHRGVRPPSWSCAATQMSLPRGARRRSRAPRIQE